MLFVTSRQIIVPKINILVIRFENTSLTHSMASFQLREPPPTARFASGGLPLIECFMFLGMVCKPGERLT